ncbi:MAG: polysaccharide export protein [Sphingomonas sp.]|nr:polysaccharide export protein [Sphingomonas sp.]
MSVFGVPEIDRTAIVDAAGSFSMPLAGPLNAAGKTPDAFAREIEEKLRGGYLKNPRVAVNIKQATNQQMVTVDGEVTQPGLYPVAGKMTLQQAVATAKGSTDTANIRNVIVFRTADGKKMAAMFDLKAIRSGRTPDPQIYGNDIVVVGENTIQKFLKNAPWLALSSLGRFIPVP